VSVGASTVATVDALGKMPTLAKLELVRELLPSVQPNASPLELQNNYRTIDSMTRSLRRGKRGRGLSDEERVFLRRVDKDLWRPIRNHVENTLDRWGAADFRVALNSGLVEVRPFAATTTSKLLELGMTDGPIDPFADDAFKEYRETILKAVDDGTTYPLFDDITGGDVVARAVRQGVILPSPAAKRRGKHGGLSGDLLQRLPMFEKASVSEVLSIRDELSEYLGGFREAVTDAAAAIEAASWEVNWFAQEAELVFRETVAPAVDRIEERVKADRDLKELSYRYGPSLLGGASSIGALLAGGSALAALAALTAGLASGVQAVASARSRRKELEGEQLYFYYRAGRALRR
jgi:hypothetical protein